jgi:hypothetical protein
MQINTPSFNLFHTYHNSVLTSNGISVRQLLMVHRDIARDHLTVNTRREQ